MGASSTLLNKISMSYVPVPVNRDQEEIDREIDELLQDEEITELGNSNENEDIIEMEVAPVGAQSSTQYTRNDGVFANMSAKPTVGGGKTFEEIEPPTYHEAVVDPSPDYFVNCVDENTGEVLIEGILVFVYDKGFPLEITFHSLSTCLLA
jgi:Protein of unknown function (DUF2370)